METPSGESAPKIQTVTAYLLKRGNRFRLSLDDAPDAEGWEVVERHTVYVDASIDRDALRREVDRLCKTPLTAEGVTNLLADLRGQVLMSAEVRPIKFVADQYVGLIYRAIALLVDTLVFMPLGIAFFYVNFESLSALQFVLIQIGSSIVNFAYRIGMHARWGQTLGKMTLDIVVRDVSGAPIGWRQAFLRETVDIAFAVVGIGITILHPFEGFHPQSFPQFTQLDWGMMILGWGWTFSNILAVLTSGRRQALHDQIAGTVVMYK